MNHPENCADCVMIEGAHCKRFGKTAFHIAAHCRVTDGKVAGRLSFSEEYIISRNKDNIEECIKEIDKSKKVIARIRRNAADRYHKEEVK